LDLGIDNFSHPTQSHLRCFDLKKRYLEQESPGKLWGYTTRDFAFIILALNGKISQLHFAQSQISSSLEAARDVKSTGLCT